MERTNILPHGKLWHDLRHEFLEVLLPVEKNICNSILVVNDQSYDFNEIEASLKHRDYSVTIAEDCEDAMDVAGSCNPDIILLKCSLSENRYREFMQKIHALFSVNTPYIILMSEEYNGENIIRGLNAGANDHVTLPVDPEILSIKISNLMNLREHEKEVDKLNNELKKSNERIQRERNILAKYFSRDLIDAILNGEISTDIGGEIRTASVLFCDLRRSTAIAENIEPDLFYKFLNNLFTDITDIIYGEQGSVNKFLGDGILATFGCPRVIEDDAYHCAQVAVKIRKYLDNFNEFRPKYLEGPIEMGVGISRGKLFTGNIGSVNQMEYTVLGDPVNIASRLQHLTKRGSVDILLDGSMKIELGERIMTKKVKFKKLDGRMESLDIYYLEKVL